MYIYGKFTFIKVYIFLFQNMHIDVIYRYFCILKKIYYKHFVVVERWATVSPRPAPIRHLANRCAHTQLHGNRSKFRWGRAWHGGCEIFPNCIFYGKYCVSTVFITITKHTCVIWEFSSRGYTIHIICFTYMLTPRKREKKVRYMMILILSDDPKFNQPNSRTKKLSCKLNISGHPKVIFMKIA